MSKIPTAEEFLLSYGIGHDKNLLSEDYFNLLVTKVLPEFAKIHVQAALSDAADNAETYEYPYMDGCPECGHTSTYIKKESILNAYSLENIK